MSIENLKSFDPFADEGDQHDSADESDAVASTSHPKQAPRQKSAAASLGNGDDIDIASTLDPFNPKASEAEDSSVSFPYEDPLADTADVGSTLSHLHIRIQQRNGRKTWTTLQGLSKEYNEKKLLKTFKKEFACNGHIIRDEKAGKIIQLQGDHRTKILDFLVSERVEKDTITVHGF